MYPAGQAVREAAREMGINRCGHSYIGWGDLPAHWTNLGIAQSGIRELRRVSRNRNSHNFSPRRVCHGCEIDLNRGYKLTERSFAPNSIPFGTVFVFSKVHFAMLHKAS